jgi:hypothetical protein
MAQAIEKGINQKTIGLEKQLLTEGKEKGPSHKDRPFNLPLRPQPARTIER